MKTPGGSAKKRKRDEDEPATEDNTATLIDELSTIDQSNENETREQIDKAIQIIKNNTAGVEKLKKEKKNMEKKIHERADK